METLAQRLTDSTTPAEIADGDELRALASELWRTLTGGEVVAYNVQGGPWLTERTCEAEPPCEGRARCAHQRRRPVGGTLVPRGEWRPAMELVDGEQRPRQFTSRVVLDHLRGRYSCAPEAPSWTSWVAIDIDAHTPVGASEAEQRAALAARDARLAAIWRACGWGRDCQPIVWLTPGDGFHVYLPLTRDDSANPEHTWPSAWATGWLTRHLAEAGIELRAGAVEIYPAGRRLRAPGGRGMFLLDAQRPDDSFDLELVPWAGTTRVVGGALVRRVVPTVRALLAAWDVRRRPLADWIGGERAAARWDRSWGFFALRPGGEGAAEKNRGVDGLEDRAPRSQQIDAVPGSAPPMARGVPRGRGGGLRGADLGPALLCNSPSSPVSTPSPTSESTGPLVRGPAFFRKVAGLLAAGVREPSARHDAVLTLTFYWGATSGLCDADVMGRMRGWCRSHGHVGDAAARGAFERESMGACKRYLRSHGPGWRRGAGTGSWVACAPLAPADRRGVLGAVDPAVDTEAGAILSFLAGLPRTESGRPAGTVELAGGLLRRLCPDRRVDLGDGRRRRATTVAIEELVRLGVLALHAHAARGSHGRVYTCHYRFGSGELAERVMLPAAAWEAAVAPIAPVPSLAVLKLPAELAGEPVNDAGAAAVVVANDQGDAAPPANASGNASGKASGNPSRNLPGSLFRCLLPVATAAASVLVRVLGERDVPEGRLYVLADGTRARPRVVVLGLAASLRRPVRGAWWVRQYRHRPFTPAELEHADPRTTIPLTASARPSWLRRPPRARPGADPGGNGGPPAAPAAAGAFDPRRELAAVLGADLPADLDPDLAAVMLGALSRRTPRAWDPAPAPRNAAM
jgi:hypothetical protein